MTTQSKEQLMDEMVRRFCPSFFAGLLAFMVAVDCGIPVWSTLPIGDASDFGVTTFLFVWFVFRAQATSRGGETPANLKQGSQDSDQLKVRATFAQESGVSRNNDGGDNG